jgi:Uma2 family endonuclease
MERPTIEELERILASGEEPDIEIQSDGSIRAVPKGTANNAKPVVLTAKYAAAEFY